MRNDNFKHDTFHNLKLMLAPTMIRNKVGENTISKEITKDNCYLKSEYIPPA